MPSEIKNVRMHLMLSPKASTANVVHHDSHLKATQHDSQQPKLEDTFTHPATVDVISDGEDDEDDSEMAQETPVKKAVAVDQVHVK